MLQPIEVPEGTFPGPVRDEKPATKAFKCDDCGATLRVGYKMHTAKEPWAHQSLEVVTVSEAELKSRDGSSGTLLHTNPSDDSRSRGRVLSTFEAQGLGLSR